MWDLYSEITLRKFQFALWYYIKVDIDFLHSCIVHVIIKVLKIMSLCQVCTVCSSIKCIPLIWYYLYSLSSLIRRNYHDIWHSDSTDMAILWCKMNLRTIPKYATREAKPLFCTEAMSSGRCIQINGYLIPASIYPSNQFGILVFVTPETGNMNRGINDFFGFHMSWKICTASYSMQLEQQRLPRIRKNETA